MTNEMITNRFVIRKSLIGKGIIIEFVNKKGENVKYNHDDVYNTHKDRLVTVEEVDDYMKENKGSIR